MLPKKRNRRKIKKDLKRALVASLTQGEFCPCFYCLRALKETEITIDHFIPIKDGGLNNLANYRVACNDCNKHKGNINPETQIEKYSGFLNSRIRK